MIDKSWLDEVLKHLQNSMVNPDIELELIENEKPYPFFKVRYIVEGHDIYTKELELSACKGMTPEQAADFLSFQIQQFMDEIDSTEYGGE